MQYSQIFTLFSFLIFILRICNASNCTKPPKVIYVNQSGLGGSFKTIQSAIDSIPNLNTQWTHVKISAGTYTEKVIIDSGKPCIFLDGAGSYKTIIQWSDHQEMYTSATFAANADDFVAQGITFKNTYNNPPRSQDDIYEVNIQALAALVSGDRSAFYNCSFMGVQDTLWDNQGRHYFRHCYIQGAVDFIFGNGQSIYEKTAINFTWGANGPFGRTGTITAQARDSATSPTGFVFMQCAIVGIGHALLGRAWRPFSRVIIFRSNLSPVVSSSGWGAWNKPVADLTYLEVDNYGAGANLAHRVTWMKKNNHINDEELSKFVNRSQFIDQEGWISKQPIF